MRRIPNIEVHDALSRSVVKQFIDHDVFTRLKASGVRCIQFLVLRLYFKSMFLVQSKNRRTDTEFR